MAAFMTSLAATIGVGNIAGVATALVSGGPGALFWIWVWGPIGLFPEPVCTQRTLDAYVANQVNIELQRQWEEVGIETTIHSDQLELAERVARRLQGVLVQSAHELADELQLAAAALEHGLGLLHFLLF